MDGLKKMAANIVAYKERIGLFLIGYTFNKAFDWAFNYGLYPFVMYQLGSILGFAVMITLSFLTCWAFIVFYDWAKKDWLGLETLKEVKEYKGSWLIGRLVVWMLNKGDGIAFIALSINWDPFVTVVYMRGKDRAFGGVDGKMDSRDWKIFILSTIIGNASWALAVFAGLSIFDWIIENLGGIIGLMEVWLKIMLSFWG